MPRLPKATKRSPASSWTTTRMATSSPSRCWMPRGASKSRAPSPLARTRKKIDAGSGDVFADLGFADAGERRLRVQLAMRINELIEASGLTQAKASALLGVSQPHVSELKNYKL